MLFNSTEFLIFFLAFLPCYAVVRRSLRIRNLLVTAASYIFYAGWDYRYLLLLFGTTLVDFWVGLVLQQLRSPHTRKVALLISVSANLGVLAFFKYTDFAVQALADLLRLTGWDPGWPSLNIELPVGISFYTFQSLSYTVDVYRRLIPAEKHFVRFAGYVAFFPQLVAGPIERADRLLPQFDQTLRIVNADIREGASLMIAGFFKKVVLADSLGRLVQLSHTTPGIPAPILVLGTLAFGFQIYCDFSGYSDIARGLAKWLGFSLCVNFERPYLSPDIRSFWRRWHVSLSTWLKDYLYIPLGGSRGGSSRTMVALMVTMLLGGLWHGARLNFLLWGFWHGLALVAAHAWHRNDRLRDRLPRAATWLLTMVVVFYGWLLFRASSVEELWNWHQVLLSDWSWPTWGAAFLLQTALLVGPLILVEWFVDLGLRFPRHLGLVRWGRLGGEAALLLAVIVCWTDEPPAFIYFQF